MVCARCGAEVASGLRDCEACGFPVASLRSFKIWVSVIAALVVLLIALANLLEWMDRRDTGRHAHDHNHHESAAGFSVSHSVPAYDEDMRLPGGRRFRFNYNGRGLQFWAEVQEDNQTTFVTPRVEAPDQSWVDDHPFSRRQPGKITFWWQRDAAGGALQLEIGDSDERYAYGYVNDVNRHSGRIGLASDALWWGWSSSSAELSVVQNWSMAPEKSDDTNQHGEDEHGGEHGNGHGGDGHGGEHGDDHGGYEPRNGEHAHRGEEFTLLRYEVTRSLEEDNNATPKQQVVILLKALAGKLEEKKSGGDD